MHHNETNNKCQPWLGQQTNPFKDVDTSAGLVEGRKRERERERESMKCNIRFSRLADYIVMLRHRRGRKIKKYRYSSHSMIPTRPFRAGARVRVALYEN
jgi:hypothetical protein